MRVSFPLCFFLCTKTRLPPMTQCIHTSVKSGGPLFIVPLQHCALLLGRACGKGRPRLNIYTVYGRTFSDFPAKDTVQTPLHSFVRQQQLPATQFLTIRLQNTRLPTITLLVGWCVPRVGQNRICKPYMTVYLVISLPNMPYVHHICIWPSGNFILCGRCTY